MFLILGLSTWQDITHALAAEVAPEVRPVGIQ